MPSPHLHHHPTPLLPLIALSISSALLGATLTFSSITIPALLSPSPPPALSSIHQRSIFRTLYTRCTIPFPLISLLASSMYFYLSFTSRGTDIPVHHWTGKAVKYVIAAVSSASVVPWTFLVMGRGIRRLMAPEEEEKAGEWVREELARWGWGNLGRAGMQAVAVVVGGWEMVMGE
ncbi:hypothetical protein EX30DRAFT_373003 [Ascodesmis nigricans]|uniref:DUF1772-domain-containing protein n=1 Tax=Ascodesmis nigricans TaxID=341454 RepID=A0A4S2MQF3_9PEZI|nr:hypothetical protein EX30DRAFT_373003 [Ascodesmis nigricans]